MPVDRDESYLDTHWRNLDRIDSSGFRCHLCNHDHWNSIRQAAHEVGNIVAGPFWKGSGIDIQQAGCRRRLIAALDPQR